MFVPMCAAASAGEVEPPTGIYEPPPRNDPPRWRMRGTVTTGVGASLTAAHWAVFPTELSLGARIWGPLSVTASALTVLATRNSTTCGTEQRPHAALGSLGIRADLFNGRSASWLDPFVEVHASVGGQAAYAEGSSACRGPRTFGGGGARVGVDAWLGRVALTAQLSYEHLPLGSPLSVSLGASLLLF